MPPPTRRRNTALRRLAAAAVYIVIGHFCSAVLSAPSPIGIHPLDEKYFDSELIKCKDGSKWFSRDRINDDFCDCVDGTDEPGTSACPRGRFYCRNVGSRPQFLFSSRVNDNICDCCDGSDEYDSSVNCPNTCIMGGNLEYKPLIHRPTINHRSSINIKGRQLGRKYDEWIQNLKGLKLFAIFQLVIIGLVLAFRLFGCRFKSRRRRHRLRDLP